MGCPKPNVYVAKYEGDMFVAWDAKRVRIRRPDGKGYTARLNQAAKQFKLGYKVGMQNHHLRICVDTPTGLFCRPWLESETMLQIDRKTGVITQCA